MVMLGRLKGAREARALTQRELAARAGLTPATIGRLEVGKVAARPSTLSRLAHVLGVEPDELVGPAERNGSARASARQAPQRHPAVEWLAGLEAELRARHEREQPAALDLARFLYDLMWWGPKATHLPEPADETEATASGVTAGLLMNATRAYI